MIYPNINDKVLIIDGELEGKTGIVVDEYQGWNFIQYTVMVDERNEEHMAYHNEVELIK